MDIAALSMSMLDKSLDLTADLGENLTAMIDHSMELSVNPHIGANIDISI